MELRVLVTVSQALSWFILLSYTNLGTHQFHPICVNFVAAAFLWLLCWNMELLKEWFADNLVMYIEFYIKFSPLLLLEVFRPFPNRISCLASPPNFTNVCHSNP